MVPGEPGHFWKWTPPQCWLHILETLHIRFLCFLSPSWLCFKQLDSIYWLGGGWLYDLYQTNHRNRKYSSHIHVARTFPRLYWLLLYMLCDTVWRRKLWWLISPVLWVVDSPWKLICSESVSHCLGLVTWPGMKSHFCQVPFLSNETSPSHRRGMWLTVWGSSPSQQLCDSVCHTASTFREQRPRDAITQSGIPIPWNGAAFVVSLPVLTTLP